MADKIQTSTGTVRARIRDQPPIDPRLAGITSLFRKERDADLERGGQFADPLFGMNNPAIAEIIKARRDAAFGNDPQAQIARAQGVQGINTTMATGLRSLRGSQALSGVRGGAAIGQALPVLTQANQARSALESNLALADAQRRSDALSGLESTVTGERAGKLGTQFGYGGLGAQDRSGGLQYLTSSDFLDQARKGMSGPEGKKKPGGIQGIMKDPRNPFINPTDKSEWRRLDPTQRNRNNDKEWWEV